MWEDVRWTTDFSTLALACTVFSFFFFLLQLRIASGAFRRRPFLAPFLGKRSTRADGRTDGRLINANQAPELALSQLEGAHIRVRTFAPLHVLGSAASAAAASVRAFSLCLAGDNRNKRAAENRGESGGG